MTDVIIIGGGASGMIAGIAAARQGANVLLLERLNRIGKKILVTGNGRCNLSNTNIEARYYHTNSKEDFLSPLKQINYEMTRSFFEELGIVFFVEENRVYPFSQQASSVLDVLRMELERLKVTVQTDVKITDIFKKKNRWYAVSEDGTTYDGAQVIIATGGMANMSFGCDETGYKLLKKLGHTLAPTFPTLVHILSPSKYCKMMKGTKVTCDASIWVENKEIRKEYDEVLFTEDGLSGPAIFQLSRVASKAKLEGEEAYVILDLLPLMSYDEVVATIYKRIALCPSRTVQELFVGWLNSRITIPLIKYAGLESLHIPCENLEYQEIAKLAESIKGFKFKTDGTRGYKYAQATAGGIRLEEIDLMTMASKKAEGLYITGEVLDLDGDCGGYNLQWAWSTGYLGGLSAAQRNEETK